MEITDLLALSIAAPACFLLGIFSAEVSCGLKKMQAARTMDFSKASTFILMPAHNEEKGIERIVVDVLAKIPANCRLLVVADNCSDRTAAIAKMAGAIVVERFDVGRRGKGHALSFGVNALAAYNPQCLIILDADCTLGRGSLEILRNAALTLGRPVQACNLLSPRPADGPVTKFSSFAFLIKNLIRQRGMSRIAGVGVLTGTGMAFPWHIIKEIELASGEIVEDLAMGVDLANAGVRIAFVEAASVRSDPAPSDEESFRQGRRWEHGFLSLAAKRAIPLLRVGVRRQDWSAIWTAFHLAVPPFTLLFGIGLLTFSLNAALFWFSAAGGAALAAISISLAMSAICVIAAWAFEGRGYLSARDALGLPAYLVAKGRIHLSFARRRETAWRRTKR